MNSHEAWTALLDPFVDGELPQEQADRVRAHLAVCPDCAAYVRDALAIRAAFPDAEDSVLPPDFTAAVMAKVQAHPRKTSRGLFWRKAALPLAACFALTVLIARTALPLLSAGDNAVSAADSSALSQPAEASEDAASDEASIPETFCAPEPDASAPDTSTDSGSTERTKVRSDSPAVQTAPSGSAPAAADPAPALEPAQPPDNSETQSANQPTASVPADDAYFTTLHLRSQEAGTLLADYTPSEETATELHYVLTAQEYLDLAQALSLDALADDRCTEPEGSALVIVEK